MCIHLKGRTYVWINRWLRIRQPQSYIKYDLSSTRGYGKYSKLYLN